MPPQSTTVEWGEISGRRCLTFTFCEKLTAADAASAVETWTTQFAATDPEKIVMVWDCLCMKGYEKGARQLWTAALAKLKPRIDSVWLVTASTLVGMGAAVMSMMSGITINTVKSRAEIRP